METLFIRASLTSRLDAFDLTVGLRRPRIECGAAWGKGLSTTGGNPWSQDFECAYSLTRSFPRKRESRDIEHKIPSFEGMTASGAVSQALDDFSLKNTSAAVRPFLGGECERIRTANASAATRVCLPRQARQERLAFHMDH